MQKTKVKFIFLSLLAGIAAYQLYQNYSSPFPVSAGAEHNLSGWAWSEHLGWMSFNSKNCDTDGNGQSNGGTGCPPLGTLMANYGVNVDITGLLSGYAWAESSGWTSFNSGELTGCPSGTCEARMNQTNGQVSGWARMCSGTVSGNCTGATRTDGWDGWIHLRGTGYGVSVIGQEWRGWAWGGDTAQGSGSGWISFNSRNCDANGDNLSDGVPAGCPSSGTPMKRYSISGTGNAATFEYTLGNSGNITSAPGGPDGTNVIFISTTQGSPSSITLSASGLPIGATATFIPNNACIPSCNRTLKISVPLGIILGSSYPITVTGSPSDKTTVFTLFVDKVIVFTAAPSTINPGESTTLQWDAAPFDTCSIDNGIGAVAPRDGSRVIVPANSIIYTITCNPGAIQKQVTVTVKGKPFIKEQKPQF